MRLLIKRSGSFFGLLLALSSCATVGTKVIYNDLDYSVTYNIKTVCIVNPDLVNFDAYHTSVMIYYFSELEKIFQKYNIRVTEGDLSLPAFNSIVPGTKLPVKDTVNCDFIVYGRITRIEAMKKTRDFKIEYKLIDPHDNLLKYYSSYSTTIGKTYIIGPGGELPGEERLIRNAIKDGFRKIDNYFMKQD